MMVRRHFEGIVNWTRSRQTSGFIEAINGLFQAAKRKARGYTRFHTMRTAIFLIAGKLDFASINPTVALPTSRFFADCHAWACKLVLLKRILWFESRTGMGPSENHAWFLWSWRHTGSPMIAYSDDKPRRCTTSDPV